MPRQRRASDLLPLTPPAFHVLVALADGDKHGYAVLKDVKRRTNGRVVLTAGTLYGVVRRLLAEGLIVESDERPDPALDDERRRYYTLTAFGREVVSAEADRLAAMVDLARAKRLVSKGH
jgi:DNA-binding PadR family transcriptional regulator